MSIEKWMTPFESLAGHPTFSAARNWMLLLVLITLPVVSRAATITVNSTDDGDFVNGQVTLREAIRAANSDTSIDGSTAGNGADTIIFDPTIFATAQTISLYDELPYLASDLTIIGPTTSVTVSGNGNSQVFWVEENNTVSLNNLTVTGGSDSYNFTTFGGGVHNQGTLTITNSTISGNSVGGELFIDYFSIGYGGGIYNGGTLTIINSTISNNSADGGDGGGIYNGGTLTITNSTISGNHGYYGADGGGIYNGGTLTLTNSTISSNTGIGIFSSSTALTLGHTLIVGNGEEDIRSSSGTLTSNGYNLIGTGNTAGSFNQTGDQTGVVDARLGALADNGGPTQTHALLPGSPALDAGGPAYVGPLTTDQRGSGFPRLQGMRLDIGAFEVIQLPALSINNVSIREGNSRATLLSFTVSSAWQNAQPITVQYATANGTGVTGSDYQSQTGTLTIPAGQTSGTITIPIIGDTIAESHDTLFVNLSNPTNATISDSQGIGTIINDDAGPGLSINDATVTEGNSDTVNATFTVTLSAASTQTVTVSAITSNGSARSPGDYTATGVRLTFAPGETSKTVTVPVKGDLLDETNELFYVLLSSSNHATLSRGRGVGTITDDDAAPAVSIDDISIGEGNSGQRVASLRLRLSAPTGQSVRVSYATANGTTNPATAGNDYVAVAPTVVAFNANSTVAYARVLLNGDVLNEPNETFLVNLSSAVNATIADGQAVGTILNDDSAPGFSINDVSITEGNAGTKTLTFTVTLSKASGQTVSVNYATANGTAASSSDYVAKSGSLSFAPGTALTRTISITINGDAVVESNETFYALLSGALNATISKARGTGTITNDDSSG